MTYRSNLPKSSKKQRKTGEKHNEKQKRKRTRRRFGDIGTYQLHFSITYFTMNDVDSVFGMENE
jgi:hypothetical protein